MLEKRLKLSSSFLGEKKDWDASQNFTENELGSSVPFGDIV
jgi:hypothetical protein